MNSQAALTLQIPNTIDSLHTLSGACFFVMRGFEAYKCMIGAQLRTCLTLVRRYNSVIMSAAFALKLNDSGA